MPELTLGVYVDISMFMKIGEGDWNAITKTHEPVEVIIGIPTELQSDERIFYIIRSHKGNCTLLTDMDEKPDTITICTDMFSTYAIAYGQVGEDHKCGLCHICPTFLGICYFVWLAVLVAVCLIIWIVIRRNRNNKKKA